MSHPRFLIKLNRRIRNSVCALRGKTSELDVGPDLFTSEGGYVCLDCGRDSAPELTALLGLAKAAEGASEIIEDGITGKLVPADDPEALAKAITDLLDDPLERSQLVRNAVLAARERYSLARMASETERVYREVLLGA